MHPWLPHLLTDIAAAHRGETPLEPIAPIVPLSFEEEMEEIEKWVEGEEPAHAFGYYCGLEAINFPPPDQLADEEMKQVIAAFGQMMFSWNLDIDLPESLPIPIAYKMTVDTLDMKTEIVNSGMMCFDFCTGYAPDCIFKEYCPCLDIWNDSDKYDDTNTSQEELPF
jgi:hypothetical protein